MKALFVGLGSIGARHLRNFDALCRARQMEMEVVALRSSERTLPPETARLVTRQVHTLPPDESYDLVFVTNPTHLHAITVGELKDRAGALFIEKPLFDHTQYDLQLLGLGPGQKAYVAAPLRFTAVYGALCRQLRGLPVYCVRAICSSYLPDWRKEVDYRDVYSAHTALGGGATLDLIHEWDYLYDLFGPPVQTYNMRGKVSNLEIDSDDISVYIAHWPSAVGEVHLDYFGRRHRRCLEVYSEAGTILADFADGRLTEPDGSVQDYAEDANRKYEREMEYFVDYALAGRGESRNSPQRALHVLQIALGDAQEGNVV